MLSLLRLLQDGRFHSGEALGAELGVSRAAVWKKLQALQAELGLSVHKVRGRGYRLEAPLRLLDAQCLNVQDDGPGWQAYVVPSLDSTNAEALRLLPSSPALPFYVLAERQTSGRGRRGRSWVSPFGENIYYSLVLRIEGGMRQLEGMSLAVGLALLQVVRDHGVSSAGLKWPNDVLVGERKLAGILLELSGDPADVCHVVIGIGLNVNMLAAESGTIGQAWTSMRVELGYQLDRNALVRALNRQLSRYLEVQLGDGFSALQDEWQRNHLWQLRPVALTAGSAPVEGVVLGVDQSGAIRLQVEGVERVFSGGELSLRLRDDS
ncbi:bifunctional biotin--[acetyl-CoA-carboxylase] synthetase/biotin operon repressor [Pseudomonas sp. HMWF032]|uniref:bifunctional biotin--[acetyl-CoA-carboxylase] ligase/biotin operon repressor BirA n=1 Tax=unclassified Pseudomonas TaxID=196821 RepID=UPI000D34CA11|nr:MULTISPECIES: bifunctional biotin--[acetyl-CoA-carboxylase] ligase/biotin operon repressor BirA [unclassified Pseudomonas]PTS81832.1 bifunctional biotin--[acetyl-CoA-carboxylase] synthetase/biotin operon repressor [Pseudomonas sp. HMWF032]PTT72797.1 bifunctional biotin--[acetyl-CoA-carboxylase] synthetase/biotin operon repressor [Pseudomonas sp. HMWF010]WAC45539.1 bifunctional biotin--[acetyl-CoA-carboxylase] ligase/biotin operon repressor BirA [Pseudomonas sp. SL4(2022)]